MPTFSQISRDRLAQCHPDLQRLFQEVIKYVDCSILVSYRNQADQDAAVAAGNSQTPWPTSKHNTLPSVAVDAAPYPIDFNDLSRFYMFVGFVRGVAAQMGIGIRCGADWDGDFDLKDQKFNDIDHFELLNP